MVNFLHNIRSVSNRSVLLCSHTNCVVLEHSVSRPDPLALGVAQAVERSGDWSAALCLPFRRGRAQASAAGGVY
jgi:hypothetical protein